MFGFLIMKLIDPKKTIFLLCDVQQVFEKRIYNMPALLNSIQFLLKSARSLEIPILVTEHYRKAFGPTIQQLSEQFPQEAKEEHFKIIEKRVFSMTVPETLSYL